jgi:hypothetical protein
MVQLERNQSIIKKRRDAARIIRLYKMHLRVVSILSLARLFWSSPSLRRGGESKWRSKRFETRAERRLRGKFTRIFVHACASAWPCIIFRADTDATHGRFSAPISGCSNANSDVRLAALIYLKAKGTKWHTKVTLYLATRKVNLISIIQKCNV